MSPRRSLRLPIILAVVMMGMLALLTVGWILMTAYRETGAEVRLRVTLLAVGTAVFGFLLAGTGIYMALAIKAINFAKRQSNFIDVITHELKSPIASLKLYLQTLRRRPVTEERRSGFYSRMLGDLTRLDRLIDHMLVAGRLEDPDFADPPEYVPLADAVRECAKVTVDRHDLPDGVVRLDLEPGVVRAPRNQLLVLMRNLIDNAVKYAGDPPRVDVRLRFRGDGAAVLSVADNGPGIPARQRRRIFHRFVRLESELERRTAGTGLGLYIVSKIADRIRARIRLHDADPGPGSVFEVEIPDANAAAEIAARGSREG